jgi:hypothetical protein
MPASERETCDAVERRLERVAFAEHKPSSKPSAVAASAFAIAAGTGTTAIGLHSAPKHTGPLCVVPPSASANSTRAVST